MISHCYSRAYVCFSYIQLRHFLDYAYITYRIIQCRGRDHHRWGIYFCKFRDGITKEAKRRESTSERGRDVVLSFSRLRFFSL